MDLGLFSSCSGATTSSETKQKWVGSGFSDAHQQMLTFSSPNSPCTRNTGYGGLDAVSMHGILRGFKGPFTPSQWMELEHQALIYKYITANVPVPSNLLNPIRKALESAGFSSFSVGLGAYNFGFSNKTDPELGRCRRTDGKKWRCSRDAIADHKYCERHVNRKRSRSRKPVEAQTGTTTATPKSSPMSSSTSVVLASETSNSLGMSHHQLNILQNGAPNASASSHHSRSYMNKANIGDKLQESNPNHEPSRSKFGCVSSDSLLNSYHKTSPLINCRSYGSSDHLSGENNSPHSLLQLMDNRPKTQSEHAAMSWRNVDVQSDRTQLSISVPTTASDFMSSTSSPTRDKLAVSSPVRFSRELDLTQMGLGTNAFFNRTNQGDASWIPISWENSVGGPLGEALHTAINAAGECKNTRALNLMTVGWDSITRSAPSPTGVLQKATFQSFSNSSAGSSPRTDNAYLAQI